MAAAPASAAGVDHLDDDEVLDAVAVVWHGLVAVGTGVGKALRGALRMTPKRALRRGRSSLEAAKAFTSHIDTNAINPVAWVLGPVQNYAGDLLVLTRAVQRLVTWQDSATTSFLYVVLATLTLLMALTPWAVVLPFVITWSARLFGFALLGPHMLYVGRRVDAIEAEHARELERAKALGAQPPPPVSPPADHASLGGYVLDQEAARSMPRRPCLPDVRCAWYDGLCGHLFGIVGLVGRHHTLHVVVRESRVRPSSG